jgi:hypothetical protein
MRSTKHSVYPLLIFLTERSPAYVRYRNPAWGDGQWAAYQCQLDDGTLDWTPKDEDACIRAAAADAPSSPYRELANPEWLARVKAMPEYRNLHNAAYDGDVELARGLLAAGADPDLQDHEGSTPMMAAGGAGREGTLRLLLARNAAVDAVGGGLGACGRSWSGTALVSSRAIATIASARAFGALLALSDRVCVLLAHCARVRPR